jgi:predicted nucleotidyltransferase
MVNLDRITALSERIVREFQPDRIILFGSYAYGEPSDDSDVDLLVVLPFQGKAAYKAGEIRTRVRPDFPIDLIVRSPQQVQDRLAMDDWFIREIFEKGQTLYETHDNRVGAEG